MISQTDRSLNALQEEISELKISMQDVRKSTYALVRVTFKRHIHSIGFKNGKEEKARFT